MQVVAAAELVDQIRRHLAPTAHRCEVGRNVIGVTAEPKVARTTPS